MRAYASDSTGPCDERCVAKGGSAMPVTMESYEDALECARCGQTVRWDLADSKFWGFASNCPLRSSKL